MNIYRVWLENNETGYHPGLVPEIREIEASRFEYKPGWALFYSAGVTLLDAFPIEKVRHIELFSEE